MDGERCVAVATDSGLELFDAKSVELDETGRAHNLMSGTEYAVLTDVQAAQFLDGRHNVESQDEVRHVGAFALIFTNPSSQIESQTV